MALIPPGSGPDSPLYGTRTDKGMRWISRGFWKRESELLALASLDEAAGFFRKSLELRAFRFEKSTGEWSEAGLVFKNTINNFPPIKLRTGDWMMSRRMFDYSKSGVHFLVGGVKALGDWQSFPVLGSASELKAEEPDWWILPDNRLAAVFRDNRRSGFLYRSLSTDDGRTWTPPVKTNFPDATSKISGLRLRDGRYVLVSNPNPKKRDPLTLSVSEDGLVFTKMLYLVGGRHIDYPHVIEHQGSLFIAFAGGKQTVEVRKVKLSDLDAVKMPEKPLNADPGHEIPKANPCDLGGPLRSIRSPGRRHLWGHAGWHRGGGFRSADGTGSDAGRIPREALGTGNLSHWSVSLGTGNLSHARFSQSINLHGILVTGYLSTRLVEGTGVLPSSARYE